jgi:hypothetical protein
MRLDRGLWLVRDHLRGYLSIADAARQENTSSSMRNGLGAIVLNTYGLEDE